MEKKTIGTKMYGKLGRLFMIAAASSLVFSSCKDEYIYDDEEPAWLGSSIYGELQQRGNFQNFLKIIEDCGEMQTLNLTGSKTLFVADDDAFTRFYNSDNEWGVRSYEDFTSNQKSIMLNFLMLNNAYLIETLSNYNDGGLKENAAMRRSTSVTYMYTANFMSPEDIPAKEYWSNSYRKDRGMYLWEDDTDWTMVYFLQKQLDYASVKNEDVELILDITRSEGDAHIFNKKVVERDVTCKNGYIHVLEDVLVPPKNMSQHINSDSETKLFASQMDRFSAPYYAATKNENYKAAFPEFTDSIFTKRYLHSGSGSINVIGSPGITMSWMKYLPYPDGTENSDYYLPFDPAFNSYYNAELNYTLQADMAAMFVPSDEAMERYFNIQSTDESGSQSAGSILMELYGKLDSIPLRIINEFISRHMMPSFVNAVPSKFDRLIDVNSTQFPVTESNIQRCYVASNGLIYHVNEVFPPDSYSSVFAPVLFSVNMTSLMTKAIDSQDYDLYLNSMSVPEGGFSLLAPTDKNFKYYIDPVTYGTNNEIVLEFVFNDRGTSIVANAYQYNSSQPNEVGDLVKVINNASYIENRITDILESHIVVDDISKGGYFITKGGQYLYVTGSGDDMKIQGSGDIENGKFVNIVKDDKNQARIYNQKNGKTYFVDKPIETATKSVFKTLQEAEAGHNLFYQLAAAAGVFESTDIPALNRTGDMNVKFFDTYRYTVYVPTDEALVKVISEGKVLPAVGYYADLNNDTIYYEDLNGNRILGYEEMYELTNEQIDSCATEFERFIRYHFQDGSVFIDDTFNPDVTYQSATIKLAGSEDSYFNTYDNKYYKIGVEAIGSGSSRTLELTTEDKNATYKAKVLRSINGVKTHNILTKDYTIKLRENAKPETDYESYNIETSSVAVIHFIDNVLFYANSPASNK